MSHGEVSVPAKNKQAPILNRHRLIRIVYKCGVRVYDLHGNPLSVSSGGNSLPVLSMTLLVAKNHGACSTETQVHNGTSTADIEGLTQQRRKR